MPQHSQHAASQASANAEQADDYRGGHQDPLVELARIVSEGTAFAAPADTPTQVTPAVVEEPVASEPPADLSQELEAELFGDPGPAAAVAAPAAAEEEPVEPSPAAEPVVETESAEAEALRLQQEHERQLHQQYLEQQAAYEAELAAYHAAIAAMQNDASQGGEQAAAEPAKSEEAVEKDTAIADLGQSVADISAVHAALAETRQPEATGEPAVAVLPVPADTDAEYNPDFNYDLSAIPQVEGQGAEGEDGEYDAEFNPENEAVAAEPNRGLLVAASIIAVLLVSGGAYAAYRGLAGSSAAPEPPLIRADASPVKRLPDSDGLAVAPDRGVYGRIAGGKSDAGPEKLVSREEKPVRTVPTTGPGITADSPESATGTSAPSKSVRTFVVRPDGSFMSQRKLPSTVSGDTKGAKIKTVAVKTVPLGTTGTAGTGSVISPTTSGSPLILEAPKKGGATGSGTTTDERSDATGVTTPTRVVETSGTEPLALASVSDTTVGRSVASTTDARPVRVIEGVTVPETSGAVSPSGTTTTLGSAAKSGGLITSTSGASDTKTSGSDAKVMTSTTGTDATKATAGTEGSSKKTETVRRSTKPKARSTSTGSDPLTARKVRTTRTTTTTKKNAPLSLLPEVASASTGPVRTETRTTRPTTPTRTASVSPTRTTPTAATGSGSYMVQVVSRRSEDAARTSYASLQRKYPRELGSRSPIIRRAEVGSKGVYYRVYIGRFDRENAYRVCGNLKNAGGDCLVSRRTR